MRLTCAGLLLATLCLFPAFADETKTVQTVVHGGGGVAGAVIWSGLGGDDLPPGTFAVAGRVALDALGSSREGRDDLLVPGPRGLAVGIALADGDAAALAGALARIASPRDPGRDDILEALEAHERAVDEAWADPRALAEKTALAGTGPGWRQAMRLAGRPRSLSRIDPAHVTTALERMRSSSVRTILVGPDGLEARVRAALSDRLGAAPSGEGGAAGLEPAPADGTVMAVFDAGEGEYAGQVGLAIASAVEPEVGRRHATTRALLLEVLSEGNGSLAQRLEVALGRDANPRAMWRAAGDGGGVIVFSVRVRREEAQTAWNVLSGATRSVTRQTFLTVAALEGRKRLDARAAARGSSSAETILQEVLESGPPAWPPSDRWSRPIGSDELLAAARELLAPERSTVAVAGAVPLELLRQEPFASAPRVSRHGLCPEREDLSCPIDEPLAGLDETARVEEAMRRARAAMALLRDGKGEALPPRGFRARYDVEEMTPLGGAELDLVVESSGEGVFVLWSSPGWTLEAWTAESGVDVRVDGEPPVETPVAGLDRIESFALREPVVLAGAVIDGLVSARALDLECAPHRCPAIEAFLAEGSRLTLILDNETLRPDELRIWWRGAGPPQPPDEVLSFRAWKVVGGFEVAGRVEVRSDSSSTDGPDRIYVLRDWSWRGDNGVSGEPSGSGQPRNRMR